MGDKMDEKNKLLAILINIGYKIKKSYFMVDISDDVFKEILKTQLTPYLNIKESDLQKAKETFEAQLRKQLNEIVIKHCLEKETFTKISNYISTMIDLNSDSQTCINSLNSVSTFLNNYNIPLHLKIISMLINKNNEVNHAVKEIVDNFIISRRSISLNKITNNKFILALIDCYCVVNNIYTGNTKSTFSNDCCSDSLESDENYYSDYFDDSDTVDIVKLYLNNLNFSVLSEEEERNLFIKYREGDKNAKEQIIEHNLRLVVSIAKKYSNNREELLDLISEGNLGLLRAVDKFDLNKNCKFSTYATWWIKQAITRAIDEKRRIVKLPVYFGQTILTYKRVRKQLEQILYEEPSDDLIAEKMGISIEQLQFIKGYEHDVGSLNSYVGEEDDAEIGDFVPSEEDAVETSVLDKIMIEGMYELLNLCSTNERDKDIMYKRFGIGGEEREHTLEETAQIYGITRERVRQIESKMLRNMQNKIKAYPNILFELASKKSSKSISTTSIAPVKKKHQIGGSSPKSIYELCSSTKSELVDLGISRLKDEADIKVAHLAWGDDFSTPSRDASITNEDKIAFYSRVIPKIRKNINDEIAVVKAENRASSIYDTFIEYNREIVDECIKTLPISYIEIIQKREQAITNLCYTGLTEKENTKYTNCIIPRLRKMLANVGESTYGALTQEDCNKFYSIIKNSDLAFIFKILDVDYAMILLFYLGFYNNTSYTIKAIAKLYNKSKEEIRVIVNNSAIKFINEEEKYKTNVSRGKILVKLLPNQEIK